jgi:hypothetical protein
MLGYFKGLVMGFSLKKVVKAVAQPVLKIATAPVTIPLAIVNKVGLSEEVKAVTTVDTKNLSNVINETTKLQGSTGSDEFKSAVYDAAKIGIASAGAGGAISGTTAVAGVAVTAKAQAGGGVSVGDIGSVFGIPTGLGGLDLSGVNIVKPKSVAEAIENIPEYLEDAATIATNPNNRSYVYIGLSILALIVGIFIIRKLKK